MPARCLTTARLLLVMAIPLAFGACEDLRAVQKGSTMKGPEKRIIAEKEELVLPVVEEQARIEKRTVEAGRVRVNKRVTEREVRLEDALAQESIRVERVPVDRFVEAPVPVRYEGDTMIVPVLEEVPVVVKRLRLKEEWHIVRERTEAPYSTSVTVRREEVSVDRQRATGEAESAGTARSKPTTRKSSTAPKPNTE